jgi:hypothetical protein
VTFLWYGSPKKEFRKGRAGGAKPLLLTVCRKQAWLHGTKACKGKESNKKLFRLKRAVKFLLNYAIVSPNFPPVVPLAIESIKWFIEDQAFLRPPCDYWLGSSPTLSLPVSSETCLSFSVFLCVAGQARVGEEVGVEPNQTTTRKPGPLKIIQYSLPFSQDTLPRFNPPQKHWGNVTAYLGLWFTLPQLFRHPPLPPPPTPLPPEHANSVHLWAGKNTPFHRLSDAPLAPIILVVKADVSHKQIMI